METLGEITDRMEREEFVAWVQDCVEAQSRQVRELEKRLRDIAGEKRPDCKEVEIVADELEAVVKALEGVLPDIGELSQR